MVNWILETSFSNSQALQNRTNIFFVKIKNKFLIVQQKNKHGYPFFLFFRKFVNAKLITLYVSAEKQFAIPILKISCRNQNAAKSMRVASRNVNTNSTRNEAQCGYLQHGEIAFLFSISTPPIYNILCRISVFSIMSS